MDTIIKEPVYLQICKILKDLIEKGEYSRGNRFLSEREVSSRFDVSRTTANKSLSSMVGEGILTYKKGVGTFVSSGNDKVSVNIQEFLKTLKGLTHEIKVFCERSYSDIPEAIQSVFNEDNPIFYIMTVYSVNDYPMLINRKYINTPKIIDSGDDFIENEYFKHCLVKKEISLTKLKKNDAPLFNKNEGETHYLIRDELSLDSSVIYDVSLLDSDKISLTMGADGLLNIQSHI